MRINALYGIHRRCECSERAAVFLTERTDRKSGTGKGTAGIGVTSPRGRLYTVFPAVIWHLWREFWRDPWQARFVRPLLIVNLLGSVYGFYWYHEQLAATPFYSWPFVPDSPLATTLFALALAGSLAGLKSPLLRAVACTASIKYGLWAVVVISQFWWLGGQPALAESMLWLSHLGMAAQGFVYLRRVCWSALVALFTGGWMFLNDALDYRAGLHPYLFAAGQETAAAVTATALSGLLFTCLWRRRRPAGERF